MSSIASRTAYVLLAAIEEDFRAIIESFGGEADPKELIPQPVADSVRERRQRDGLAPEFSQVPQTLAYLDFQDSFDLALRLSEHLPQGLAASLKAIKPSLTRAVSIRNRVAHNRPLEVDDLPHVVDFASDLTQIEGWHWTAIDEARSEIRADPAFIFRASSRLIVDPSTAVPNNLPSPDFDETSLLGRKEERRQVTNALLGSWPVVSILGDGGVGKTALALQVCYDLVERSDCPFEAVVWVSAKNAQLTSNEIVTINSAVEDSLGLFASASASIGGAGESDDAVDELLAILGSFPTLLILDNVETVLDDNFPRLLTAIPVGSKILITSRIGVKTENPYKLTGLSVDDGKKLLRILARVRNLQLADLATDAELTDWVSKMGAHPAYLKWFIAGVQAGQTPETLLTDNALLLEFCMSNVYDFLGDDSRSVLQAMVVVPGSHTLAELAFLCSFDSARIRAAVTELTTTNFVAQVRGGSPGTALQLSDFARGYLRLALSIPLESRQEITRRQRQLYSLGGGLQAAHKQDPYSPETIDIRGVGDYSAARLLRQAMDKIGTEQVDTGLVLCSEAAELAPGYHEAARVQGYLHEAMANYGEAFESYSLAKDLARDNPYTAFFFGKFLLTSGIDPELGLRELQRAATRDPDSAFLQLEISQAHLEKRAPQLAMEAAAYALSEHRNPTTDDRWYGGYWLFRACAARLDDLTSSRSWAEAAEVVEFACQSARGLQLTDWSPDTLDLALLCGELLSPGSEDAADDYIARKVVLLVDSLKAIRGEADLNHLIRRLGRVESKVEGKGFGFIRSGHDRFFFHARDLWDRRYFDSLVEGQRLAFEAGEMPTEGHRPARIIRWLP